MKLSELYKKYYDPKTGWPDKGTHHSYIEVYEEILAPYRNTARNILEVGLMNGESLRMWMEYFHGNVYGMDCDLKPLNGKADLTKIREEHNNVFIGDATNAEDIDWIFRGKQFDVIIEDAGHDINQQFKIFNELYGYLKKGGIYIIEDVQDIDRDGHLFVNRGMAVVDRRKIKNRYDDVLVIIRK